MRIKDKNQRTHNSEITTPTDHYQFVKSFCSFTMKVKIIEQQKDNSKFYRIIKVQRYRLGHTFQDCC